MRRVLLFVLLLAALPARSAEVGSNTAAKTSGATTEVLVSSSATTTLPATPLVGRRSVAIQNLGPNALWCSIGSPTTPVVGKSWKIDSLASGQNVLFLDISDKILVRCIAATATQVTGAATIVVEVN